ncbi:MAG: DUF1553 domain-containing protein [Planctomycetaceae bacterium]
MPRLKSSTLQAYVFCAAFVVGTGHASGDSVKLIPRSISLQGPEGRHQILVERYDGEEAIGPADPGVIVTSDDSKVARVENNVVIATGNGTTTIRLEGDAETDAVTVNVRGFDDRPAWSFRNDIQPIMARLGCNSGPCHGALAGKGGFRLSLRGYDPERDHFSMVHQQQGRRVELSDPAYSLLLTKPTQTVPHKGGLRLVPESRHYRVLSQWIADGAAPPADSDPVLQRLQILPERATLTADQHQPFLVIAHYSDGRVLDVTELAKFSSSNEAVATVNDDGVAHVVGPGEGAVTAWFSSQIAIGRITVPFPQSIDPSVFTHAARRNYIDDLVLAQLRRLNLKPSPRSTDEVFVRRAYLDAIGTLPTVNETRDFLADKRNDKRDRLIDALLDRPEFADYWSYHWSDLLLINGTELRPEAVKSYYQWIHKNVEENTPWDKFVYQLVTSRGSSFENGATNFYALHQAPEDMAENVSQAFLGLSIGCAKCHNHPLEKWTNDQYYAFANLFSRVRGKGWGGDSRNGDGLRILVTASSGELVQPRTGKPQLPTPLDGEAIPLNSEVDRREYMANWLISPQNKLFARSITNRVWKNYFGVGLVEEVDDMRASNPASSEELLNAAAQSLIEADFDLKSLMRDILRSETWQRGSQPQEENRGDQRHYSRYYPRRLMAEVLLDAISAVADVPTEFSQVRFPGGDVRKTDFYPTGTKAIQLYDSAVDSYFLQTFGRNQRRITCECERSDEPSMVQVLHIANGDTLNEKLQSKNNRLERWLAEYKDNASLLDEVFITALSRYPTEREQNEILSVLETAKNEDERRELLEDAVWGVLSSREFLFNH